MAGLRWPRHVGGNSGHGGNRRDRPPPMPSADSPGAVPARASPPRAPLDRAAAAAHRPVVDADRRAAPRRGCGRRRRAERRTRTQHRHAGNPAIRAATATSTAASPATRRACCRPPPARASRSTSARPTTTRLAQWRPSSSRRAGDLAVLDLPHAEHRGHLLPELGAQRPPRHAPHHQHDVHDRPRRRQLHGVPRLRHRHDADIIGNLPGASKAYMPRAPVAPENANLGRSIPREHAGAGRHALLQLHARSDILREFWMNIYYVPKDAGHRARRNQIRGMGGFGWTSRRSRPARDMVYQYECPITATAASSRCSATTTRTACASPRHPAREAASARRSSRCTTTTTRRSSVRQHHREPDVLANARRARSRASSRSSAGDVLEWECHVINDSQRPRCATRTRWRPARCATCGASRSGPVINCVLLSRLPFLTAPRQRDVGWRTCRASPRSNT